MNIQIYIVICLLNENMELLFIFFALLSFLMDLICIFI